MAHGIDTHEVTVAWGESDPFGLVYYPCILAWFNEAEHAFFRAIGEPVDAMIRRDRTTFVMGEVHFHFRGPAACGDRVRCDLELREIRRRTLHWNCRATHAVTGGLIAEGTAVRVYARLGDAGDLTSADIPQIMRDAILRGAGDPGGAAPLSD
jgi:acyl-CoA thioesterase FadM